MNNDRKDTIRDKADLHTHSYYSDGLFSPQQIIKRASQLGLRAVSITDHDNIDAIQVASHVCDQFSIEFIPGVEISARHGEYDLHLLGYFIDHNNKILNEFIDLFKDEREKRAKKIIKRLNQVGIKIGIEFVMERAYPGSIGRPHIAHVMVEQGYVFSYKEAFQKYLGDGCSCNVQKYKVTPAEAIKLINQAGGISFIAHPGVDISIEGILELIKIGVEGIETVHPRHSAEQIECFRKIIEKYHLLECGGSDCHGSHKEEDVKLGKFTIPYQLVVKMKERLKYKN